MKCVVFCLLALLVCQVELKKHHRHHKTSMRLRKADPPAKDDKKPEDPEEP
jgi:hypothetical protein